MNKVISNRASRSSRVKGQKSTHEWLTAEEMGRSLNLSGDAVREMLYSLGHGCKESKKPTTVSFDRGLARMYRHGGKRYYKWNRRAILPQLFKKLEPDT